MSTPLTRDDVFAMLPELALGMLPADEAARVMEFVQSSPECQAELASLRGAAGALDSSIVPEPMPAARKSAVRERLLARAAAPSAAPVLGLERSAGNITPSTEAAAAAQVAPPVASVRMAAPKPSDRVIPIARPNPIARFVPWFAAAASIGIAIAQVRTNGKVVAERDAARDAMRAATTTASQLSDRLASSDSLIAAMSGAQVRVVELASTSKLPPGARMFWDRLTNRWTLITHDLTPAQSGRTYQLWLVTAKAQKISAGTFNTDAKGRAVVQATYALAENDLAAIAITEEPEGGSPQPTGTILVAGAPTR